MSDAVVLEGVSFSYGGPLVLEEVNLRVARGDFVAVVGPNGGGKTTLVRLILGLLHPRSGRVRVLGLPPGQARSRLGYMPQHPVMDLAFPASVRDVVLMGRLDGRWRWRYRAADRLAADQALERVGLAGLGRRPFASLSGGQRQRALIARALVSQPEVLLLDEPTANVDPAGEEGIYELLRRLNQSMTVVAVTHDLGFVSPYVGHVICVNRRVATHPTSRINGELISQLYGRPMSMVRHDHWGPPGGCDCA